jgi:hypothetical protein
VTRCGDRDGRVASSLGAYHRAVRRATARLSPSERAAVAAFLDEVTRAALRAADRLWEANADDR